MAIANAGSARPARSLNQQVLLSISNKECFLESTARAAKQSCPLLGQSYFARSMFEARHGDPSVVVGYFS
jgi:hypothetical protein